jgi:nitroreductase
MTIVQKHSSPDFEIHPLLKNRWSPRAMDESATISDSDLLAILEAARWAPSAMNEQPWRFFIGRRGDEIFKKIQAPMTERNQAWTSRASVLILCAGVKDKTSHQYDVGLAVSQMVFEALNRGYATHHLTGFDFEAMSKEFGLTDLLPVSIMALGKQGDVEVMPEPAQKIEMTFSVRKPLNEIVLKGLPN